MSGTLFDTLAYVGGDCGIAAKTRNEIGGLVEEIAARALGLTLTPITAAVICPDFKLGALRGEIKAVGNSGQAIAYKWRVEKEAEHFDPSQYLYVYVRHSATVSVKTRAELMAGFSNPAPRIIACTLADVLEAIGGKPHKKFTITQVLNKHGSTRAGYCEGGWQFRLSAIATDADETVTFAWPWLFESLTCRVFSTPCFRHACKTNQM